MEIATGKAIVEGIAIGKIHIHKRKIYDISEATVENEILEWTRFENALEKVQRQEHVYYERALRSAGSESAEIFEAREVLLYDEVLIGACRKVVLDQKHTAEYAVRQEFDHAAKTFSGVEDPYIRERATDILDLKDAMLNELSGPGQEAEGKKDFESENETVGEPMILVAEDLAPSETVKINPASLLGIVIAGGSSNSHTAILARSMDLPTLIQCAEISEDWDGREAVLDSIHSCITIDPSEELIQSMTARQEELRLERERLQELKGKPNVTEDGTSIKVCANIGSPADIELVKENDADGIGLFRSEFLYMNSLSEPSEEVQFAAYKKVVEAFAPQQVIIRTCDIGADKTIDYMDLEKEENPALGFRAVRICLTRRDFFKRQLRALLRASAYGNLGIMFPMIISLREVKECKEILEECKRELTKEGNDMGDIQVGIMIETPAAALCADELAREVDFFSLGTNDLTQYTCAIDRQNAKLEPFADDHHPAVLKLIQMTVEAAHRHGVRVGICGELGADETLTESFLRMGVDELSVNPKSILPLRGKIRSLNLKSEI